MRMRARHLRAPMSAGDVHYFTSPQCDLRRLRALTDLTE